MFNWIKRLLLSAARWREKLSRRREREERYVCARWTKEQTHRERERERERCAHADQSRRTERESERKVCARWTEQTHRERERERGVCALGEQDSQKLVWVLFEGKKVAKGVCNVAKLATLCVSISPTTGRATGQTENTRCVNRVLKNECL